MWLMKSPENLISNTNYCTQQYLLFSAVVYMYTRLTYRQPSLRNRREKLDLNGIWFWLFNSIYINQAVKLCDFMIHDIVTAISYSSTLFLDPSISFMIFGLENWWHTTKPTVDQLLEIIEPSKRRIVLLRFCYKSSFVT